MIDPSNANSIQNITSLIRGAVAEHGYVDVGMGLARTLGVTGARLFVAVNVLLGEGYAKHYVIPDSYPRVAVKVLTTQEKSHQSVHDNRNRIFRIKAVR